MTSRSLADKVIQKYIDMMGGNVDCYGHSHLIGLFTIHAISQGKCQITVDKHTGIISYPYKHDKLDNCRDLTQRYGFALDLLRMPSEIPFYFEKLNLILPRDGGMHRLTTLWEFSKTNSYELTVEKMDLPDSFFDNIRINKRNKTANGFSLCDVEIDFMLTLQKNIAK